MVKRTSATHSAIASPDVICDLLLNRRTATWNLFVNYILQLRKVHETRRVIMLIESIQN